MTDLRDKVSTEGVRVKIFALFCVTVIALVALLKLTDPENIIINIIVAIGSFLGGGEAERRRMDSLPSPGTHTLTETTTENRTNKEGV